MSFFIHEMNNTNCCLTYHTLIIFQLHFTCVNHCASTGKVVNKTLRRKHAPWRECKHCFIVPSHHIDIFTCIYVHSIYLYIICCFLCSHSFTTSTLQNKGISLLITQCFVSCLLLLNCYPLHVYKLASERHLYL